MKKQIIGWIGILSLGLTAFGQGKTLYRNDFEKTELGQVPQDFLVLDGAFSVKRRMATDCWSYRVRRWIALVSSSGQPKPRISQFRRASEARPKVGGIPVSE